MSETTDSFREYVNRNKEIEDSDLETQIIKILYHIDEGNNLSDIAIDSIDSSYDVGCSEARYQRVVDRINLLMNNIDLGSMKWFEVANGLTATQITELRAAGISIGEYIIKNAYYQALPIEEYLDEYQTSSYELVLSVTDNLSVKLRAEGWVNRPLSDYAEDEKSPEDEDDMLYGINFTLEIIHSEC